MRMRNQIRLGAGAVLAVALCALGLYGQSDDPNNAIAIDVPADVPLEFESKKFENSEIRPRGGALVVDLDGEIRLRNTSANRIRGITVAVSTSASALGGRAIVSVPSLNVAPGESFPLKLNMRLLRPLPAPAGAIVHATVDGVLYDTLAFIGPNLLDSERRMTVREMEARRDREYFQAMLASAGSGGIVEAMQSSLRRQAERPALSARLAGRSGAAIVGASEPREVALAMVGSADAPVLMESGSVLVTGLYSDAPSIRLTNRSNRRLRSFELGWLIRDSDGTLYSAGSVPMETARALDAGAAFSSKTDQKFAFRPARPGSTSTIDGMSVYVRNAQFADGRIWIPSRGDLEAASLLDVVPASAEEQRLSSLYRDRGPAAVIEELRKFE